MFNPLRRIFQRLSGSSLNTQDKSLEQHADGDEAPYPPVVVANGVCEATCKVLRSHSPPGEQHEGITYWAGTHLDRPALLPDTHSVSSDNDDDLGYLFVTSCITPEAKTSPRNFSVSAISNSRITEAIQEHNLEIIGAVHSHPGKLVDHSGTDNDGAFLPFDGYYSVVVPEYAQYGMNPLSNCGIHRYEEQNDEFRLLKNIEVDDTFSVLTAPVNIDTRP